MYQFGDRRLPGRFWSKVTVADDSDCWVWNAGCFTEGYGAIKVKGETVYAHRLLYGALVGDLIPGMQIDHTCHNADTDCIDGRDCKHRKCVNPLHLEQITPEMNKIRGRMGHSRNRSTARASIATLAVSGV